MIIQPEQVALAGFLLVLVLCPLTAVILAFIGGHARWIGRAFAAILIVLWLPLICDAPQIIAQLA